MTVYIAGPMTGIENYNREAFSAAEEKLRADGHLVINPAVLPVGLPDSTYMPICTAMIDAADAVYLLQGWVKSMGAVTESFYAARQGKVLMYEEDPNEALR